MPSSELIAEFLRYLTEGSFFEQFITGILVVSFVNFIYFLSKFLFLRVSKIWNKSYLEGFWLTDFVAEKNHIIELYQFSAHRNLVKENDIRKLKLSVQHYGKGSKIPVLYGRGTGTVQGRNIIFVYYTVSNRVQRTGTLVLKLRDNTSSTISLRGRYNEFLNEEIVSADSGEIELNHFQMKFWDKIKHMCGLKFAKNYDGILKRIDPTLLSHLSES